ncbi:auxin-induced protein 15A-like [Rutidosis leptorrhynchoides]|uniref:auxin-induced protein 15A-like n=1 Tax=Rutidosis leptorrhynchoides TaxID=125765 RepID=UPI003A9959C6
MGFRLPGLINTTQKLRRSSSKRRSADVPKGYLALYVGEREMKRVVIPISYLNHPEFLNLLSHSEEEFGFDHPMGGLTIPCREDVFTDLVSRLNGSSS